MIRPTARLRFEIDESKLNDPLVADIKNCFLNIAPVKVVKRPDVKDGKAAENILGLVVVLNYPYWDSSTEKADTNWSEVLVPWLKRKLYKLNATVQGYMKSRAYRGEPLAFGQLELTFGRTVIAVRLPRDCSFPEKVMDIVELVRKYDNEKLFPEGEFLRIEAPWWDPDFGQTEKATEEEGPASESDAETLAQAVEGEDRAGEGQQELPENEESQKDETESSGVDEPRIDYAIWGVRTAGDEIRLFDSDKKEWIDE